MGSRKIIIIVAGVIALGAVAVVLFSVLSKNKVPPPVVVENPPSTSTGDVTEVKPGPTPFGRAGFTVKIDPANPFASNSPRSKEPLPVIEQPTTGFNDYNQAIASGLIADKNGLYKQTVDTDTIAAIFNKSGTNYTLSGNNFLDTYYGDANAVISGTNISGSDNPDQIIVEQNQALSADLLTIPLVPEVDQKLIPVKEDISRSSVTAYINGLSSVLSDLDISHNESLNIKVFTTATSDAELNALKQQATNVQTEIATTTTPKNMLGLSQEYYLLYQTYKQLIDDRLAINRATRGNADDLVARVENNMDKFSTILTRINADIEIARNILSQ